MHDDQPWHRLPALAGMADAVALLQDRDAPISAWQTPAKLTDALAMGIPVIATPTAPLAELATPTTIRLVATPSALDDALRAVADRLADGRAGRALFGRELSFAANRPRLAAAQAACLARPRAATPLFDQMFALLEAWSGMSLTRPGARSAAMVRASGGAGPAQAMPAAPTHAERARTALQDARAAEGRGDFAAAAALLDAGLKLAPRHADMLSVRARVAFTMGDVGAAETHARAALLIRPELTRATIILARIAMAAGRTAEAVELWAAVPPGHPAYRERMVKRGRLLLGLGRPLEALGEFADAVRRHPGDPDALRGAAEATEATGALRTALARWRALLALVPGDAAATEAVRLLELRLAPLPGLPSPLRNPWLREWRGPLEGHVGPAAAEPSPGLSLRADQALHYAIAEAQERRPGELPSYGLWLRAEGGGAELGFALDPSAAALAVPGLRMGIEVQAPGSAVVLRLALHQAGGGVERLLAEFESTARRRLVCFDLRLDSREAAALASGRLAIAVRMAGPGSLVVLPPRPFCRLDPEAAPPEDFETPMLATALPAAQFGACRGALA